MLDFDDDIMKGQIEEKPNDENSGVYNKETSERMKGKG